MSDNFDKAERMTSAALLATVSFALVVLVLQLHPGDTRWPNGVLLLFVLSGIALVTAVQSLLWMKKDVGAWAFLLRLTYNGGTFLLFGGLAVLLVPGGSLKGSRWAPLLAACVGLVVELLWVAAALRGQLKGARRMNLVDRWNTIVNQEQEYQEQVETRKILSERYGSIDAAEGAYKDRGRVAFTLSAVKSPQDAPGGK